MDPTIKKFASLLGLLLLGVAGPGVSGLSVGDMRAVSLSANEKKFIFSRKRFAECMFGEGRFKRGFLCAPRSQQLSAAATGPLSLYATHVRSWHLRSTTWQS